MPYSLTWRASRADRVDRVGIVLEALEDVLEFAARLRVTLIHHQHARVIEAHVARLRILLEIAREPLGRLAGRAPLQQLGLVDGGNLPVGPQRGRAPDFGERERLVVRRIGCLRTARNAPAAARGSVREFRDERADWRARSALPASRRVSCMKTLAGALLSVPIILAM
jgi:hypothetical protein